jgi:hypothetical protein
MSKRGCVGAVAIILLLASGLSCQSAPKVQHEPLVTHIVIAWLKQPGDQAARQRVIDASKQRLRTIPGVVSVTSGTPIPSTRPVVDSSFDVSIIITFRSVEDLNRYPKNPTHQQMVAELIKPLVARYVIYDVYDAGR